VVEKTKKTVKCTDCNRMFATLLSQQHHFRVKHDPDFNSLPKGDWSRKCEVCGQSPVVIETGLCGPCTFGEADTAGGNW